MPEPGVFHENDGLRKSVVMDQLKTMPAVQYAAFLVGPDVCCHEFDSISCRICRRSCG
jgi:hypothetical protein